MSQFIPNIHHIIKSSQRESEFVTRASPAGNHMYLLFVLTTLQHLQHLGPCTCIQSPMFFIHNSCIVTRTHTHTCTHTHTYTHTHVYTNACTHTHTHTHVYTNARTHTIQMHAHTQYKCTHTHNTHAHTHTHTHTLTHICTHTFSL